MVEFKDITKDEVEYYRSLMKSYDIESMDLNSAEAKHGELLNTILSGDGQAVEEAKKVLKAVEKQLHKLRAKRAEDEEKIKGERQKKEMEEEIQKQLVRQHEHEEIMQRQTEISSMSLEELMREKDRIDKVNFRDKSAKRKAEAESILIENRLSEISQPLLPPITLEAPSIILPQETDPEIAANEAIEQSLCEEQKRLYHIMDFGTEEEAEQAENDLVPILEQLRVIRTARKALRSLRRAEEEEAENIKAFREEEAKKKHEKEEKEREQKEGRKAKLEEKFLKEAELRYLNVYRTKGHDNLIEAAGLQGPMTKEIVTSLAQILCKIENQRITLNRLIEKRERLDKEILSKSGSKGITDRDKLAEAFSIKEISQYLRAEKLDYDSDEFHELESTDEEDMPRTRNISDGKGGTDVKFEHALSYVSRLRKSAKEGNIKLRANYNILERKIEQLLIVQKEIDMTYKEKIKPIREEFWRKTEKLNRELTLSKKELDEVKVILSKGFRSSTTGQSIALEAEIEKVREAHKLTVLKLTEEIEELKKTVTAPGSDKKRILDLTVENRKLLAKLKEPSSDSGEELKLKAELHQLKEEKQALEDKLIEVEVNLEMSLEETANHKEQAEHIAMAAQNRYNALVVKQDEDLATIRRDLVDPVIRKNQSLVDEVQKAWAERNSLQKETDFAKQKYDFLDKNVVNLLAEKEKEVWNLAKKKFTKEVGEIATQTEISIPQEEVSSADVADSQAIRFEMDLKNYLDEDLAFASKDKRKVEDRRTPLSFAEYKDLYTDAHEWDDEEEKLEYASEYAIYVRDYKPPPFLRDLARASVCTPQELLNYRTRVFQDALNAIIAEKNELNRSTANLNKIQTGLAVEKKRYEEAAKRTSIQLYNYKNLAKRLSELDEGKYKQTSKFFSYPISEWSEKFKETFDNNQFAFININTLDLEESKDLFTLLTEINRHTGSKSHIWYGNELNRRFNHRDSLVRPKSKSGLIQRAQDTFVGWLNADAAIGFVDLENEFVTTNSIAYSKLLNSIGNVTVKRTIFTG